jgi:hypothetical protein
MSGQNNDNCGACISDFVFGIIGSITRCITLKIVSCVTTIATTIENLVLMIENCSSDKTLADSEDIHRLWQLIAWSNDFRMQRAAVRIQSALNTTLRGVVV